MKTKLLFFAIFLALTGCSTTEDPAPSSGVVTVSLTNNATLAGMAASACVRSTPMRAGTGGSVLWSKKMTCTTATMGPVARGTRVYLSVQYDDVNSPGYLLPTQGEYIQADLLVDGKKVSGVFLDANSFYTEANYFRTDGNRVHLMQEVEVVL
ncbi:hypothetical protein [Hymenobacter arizonensis]|uniref:Lipoprotein n=1 Tax=Hymenobacter arizonensis TaxID=1227077 RepID=A0A1I5T116_HYMAR|nr:hypothetical protein [Hymenobacter arizonensis]SFP76729.1 hypothetical protein SAMN04515668_0274 [Hymenobacter arizonensis]